MKHLALMLRNLWRNRRRTILTTLSTALSLFVFTLLMSFSKSTDTIVASPGSAVRIAVHNKAGLPYLLPEAYKRQIGAIPHVEAVSAQTWFGGIYRKPSDQFANLTVDPDNVDSIWPDWGISPGQLREFKRVRTACLVGRATMRRNHWVVGQQIMLRGTLYPANVELTIVGTLGPKGLPNLLVFRRDYLEQVVGKPGRVSIIWAKVDSTRNVPQVIRAIDETFADSEHETLSEAEAPFFGCFLIRCQMLIRLAKVLCLLVLTTIGLVCANTAALSIRERQAEVAIMRSLGFERGIVFALLIGECVILSSTGGLLGCGAAYILSHAIVVTFPALGCLKTMEIRPDTAALSIAVSAMIGAVSGAIPAYEAVTMNIVDGLRSLASS